MYDAQKYPLPTAMRLTRFFTRSSHDVFNAPPSNPITDAIHTNRHEPQPHAIAKRRAPILAETSIVDSRILFAKIRMFERRQIAAR